MKRYLPLLVTTLGLGATGCSNEYWVDFQIITEAPPSVQVDDSRIEIPAGRAVGVRAVPIEDGERQEVTLDMRPARPGIVGIEESLEDGVWVIYGAAPGATSVDLYFGGELVGEMPAVVTEEHPQP